MDEALSRRDALRGLVAAAATGVVGCATEANPDGGLGDGGLSDGAASDQALAVDAAIEDVGTDTNPLRDVGPEPTGPFRHGVASGDPLPTSVILWTRVSGASAPVMVEWSISASSSLSAPVATGMFLTNEGRDYTVKVDATQLSPGTTYYYQFRVGAETSPIGRTRTAPMGSVDRLRFGLCACASLAHGYLHGYRNLAARPDLDAVVHLGDYIYEYGSGGYGQFRPYEPAHEIVSLADYRQRHAMYKREPELQEVHRQHPFITVWDDHEVTDNSYATGAENHQPSEGDYGARKAVAKQAYREWMPIREQTIDDRIFRTLRYGNLVDLILLDTRLWGREEQVTNLMTGPVTSETRQLLGADQEAWLFEQLRTSTATWKLIGQQVVMAQIPLLANPDQWDGYPAQRRHIFEFIETNRISNVVVLTGDIHTSWAFELTKDPANMTEYDPATGRGAVGVEFVTPGISSPGLTESLERSLLPSLRRDRHFRWANLWRRGYVVLDVTATAVQAAWFHVDDVQTATGHTEMFSSAWHVNAGVSRLIEDAMPATPPPNPPAPAP